MHTVEPLVPEPSCLKVEIAIEKLEQYKSPGIDQILEELIQAGGNTLHSEIHRLINSICNKKELPQQWKESVTVPNYKKGDKTVVILEEHHCYPSYIQNFIQYSCLKVNSIHG
jgi:hypothetical protein